MQHFLKFLLILILAWLSSLIVPFWGVAVAGFVASLIVRSSYLSSFLIGFIAIFILWGSMAFYIDTETSSILTDRVGAILTVDPPILILITALLGGLTGGLGSLSGSLVRGKPPSEEYY